jgi:hypothetical protein
MVVPAKDLPDVQFAIDVYGVKNLILAENLFKTCKSRKC